MKRLSAQVMVFAILFLVFLIVLVFFRFPFGPYPLMSVQDAVDLITPLVLLPLYFLMYRSVSKSGLDLKGLVILAIFAAFWSAGQGMHLSANSISNLMENSGAASGDIYKLTHFYDEILSHYFWHAGIIGLSALLIYKQSKNPFTDGKATLWLIVSGAVLYGFTFFLIIMEGNTAPLGVTFAVLATLFLIIWVRKDLRRQPLSAFFLTSYALATLLFLIWGIINGGLPPIMDVIKI